jgi:uncharacterized protein DUF222/HNH endonuclease
MPAASAPFADTGEAADWLDAALDHLAAADWASLGTQAHGEILGRLQRAQAKLTAVNAAVLAAFTAQSGYEPDGHRSAMAWLTNRTGISRGAAAGAIGWQRRLARHGAIAGAMAAGAVSESWAKEIAGWTDPLPPAERDQADEILLEAAVAGVRLADLEVLARSIWETWKARHPDPDDGNGGSGDADGFEDRRLRLGTTFGGAGKLTGDLAAGCAAKLQAIFDALGKHLGPEDFRTNEQRQHDALDEALSRLIKSGLLPQAAGTDTLAQVLIPFAALRANGSPFEAEWMAVNAGQPGWLTGIGAEAAACDAKIVPVVTGTVDWQAADAMTEVWIEAHGLDRGAEPCGCSCGGCTCHPPAPLDAEAKARLRRTLLAMAADAMSGPAGLAAYLPLDVGHARDIPDHIRRAVILRDKHCGWPGGCDVPPAGCEVHHLTEWSKGGKTSIDDLKLFCSFHHQVQIHRRGWKVIMHADGSTEAISPHGEILRSNGPPGGRTDA